MWVKLSNFQHVGKPRHFVVRAYFPMQLMLFTLREISADSNCLHCIAQHNLKTNSSFPTKMCNRLRSYGNVIITTVFAILHFCRSIAFVRLLVIPQSINLAAHVDINSANKIHIGSCEQRGKKYGHFISVSIDRKHYANVEKI